MAEERRMIEIKEQWLFDEYKQQETVMRRKPKGGSNNPIVFHDYESYVAKFKDKGKTTDDTYTPRDVYDAVLAYVKSIYPMEGKEILRPFYPGGDYEHAEYPEDGVVVDNPPFSLFMKICKFYSEQRIPFFLFGPGLTIFSCLKYCSVVVVAPQIEFSNGAKVRCNFATNMIGDTLVMSSPGLSKAIAACPSQTPKARLPKYAYPDEVLSASDLQTMAKGDEAFSIRRGEAKLIRNLDLHPKKSGIFGDHLLISKAAAVNAIPILLSEREQTIVDGLKC